MSTAEMAGWIGKLALFTSDRRLYFVVRVKDVRLRYGIVDYLVQPKDGSGERWVAETSLRFE